MSFPQSGYTLLTRACVSVSQAVTAAWTLSILREAWLRDSTVLSTLETGALEVQGNPIIQMAVTRSRNISVYCTMRSCLARVFSCGIGRPGQQHSGRPHNCHLILHRPVAQQSLGRGVLSAESLPTANQRHCSLLPQQESRRMTYCLAAAVAGPGHPGPTWSTWPARESSHPRRVRHS